MSEEENLMSEEQLHETYDNYIAVAIFVYWGMEAKLAKYREQKNIKQRHQASSGASELFQGFKFQVGILFE